MSIIKYSIWEKYDKPIRVCLFLVCNAAAVSHHEDVSNGDFLVDNDDQEVAADQADFQEIHEDDQDDLER